MRPRRKKKSASAPLNRIGTELAELVWELIDRDLPDIVEDVVREAVDGREDIQALRNVDALLREANATLSRIGKLKKCPKCACVLWKG